MRESHASVGSSILHHGGYLERSMESSNNVHSTPQRKHYSLLSQITPDRRIIPIEQSTVHNNHSAKNGLEHSNPPPITVVKAKKKKKKIAAPVTETTIDLSQDALDLSESQLQPPKNSKQPTIKHSADSTESAEKVPSAKSTPLGKAVTFPHTATGSKEIKPLRTSSSNNTSTTPQNNNKTVATSVSMSVQKVEAKFAGKNGQLRIKKKENGDQMKYDPKLFDLLDVLEQRDD